MSDLYEEFHAVTKKHSRVVSGSDYTHGPTIHALDPLIKTKKKVLDVGCGTGSISFYLANRGHQVDGIDISKRAITSCRKQANIFGLEEKTSFSVTTIEAFKPAKKYQLIVCLEVIEHVPDDQAALAKLFKLLEPGGHLLLTTPTQSAPLYRIGFLKGFDERVGHLRRYNQDTLIELIKSVGFQIDTVQLNEGLVRNFLFTSTIGGKVLLRLVNRFIWAKWLAINLDTVALKWFGPSDVRVVARKP